jgi:hypothetical protein
MQPGADSDLQAIATARRLELIAGYYVIGLVAIFVFTVGLLPEALLLLLVTEAVATFWKPTPKLGSSSYIGPPTPTAWQGPIRAVRWVEILNGCWFVAGAALFTTVGFLIFAGILVWSIASGHYRFGPANFTVAALLVGWLLTRPLWRPQLTIALGQSTQGLRQTLSQWAPAVYVTADGFDIDFKTAIVGLVGKRHKLIHVGFAELDDVRMLTWNDAGAYAQSLDTYDATLWPRMLWEFTRFIQGKLPRPTVILYSSYGAHLLMHGPSLLYLIGAGDAWAPPALAAWQAWQASRSPQMPANA